ncbi:hypothetical protein B0H13DRAFT_804691 [Mycena leptocephala]|nr:hypothetical protein B0H13DRAFT_804691 [Mycena leptocephala]
MVSSSTIIDVLIELWKRRLIGHPADVKYYVLFPRRKFASLEMTDILGRMGICDQSILHLRIAVPGGCASYDACASSKQLPFPTKTSSNYVIQRITNSPLVEGLPWSIDGIGDEGWRRWPLSSVDVPSNIQFDRLLRTVEIDTADNLSSTGTAAQLFARFFCGFDKVNRAEPNPKPMLPPGNSIFALQVIQLFAERLGMPRSLEIRPQLPLPLPKLTGKNSAVLKKLADWPSVIATARAVQSSKKNAILFNLMSAAFLLGCYRKGEFPSSSSKEIRDHLLRCVCLTRALSKFEEYYSVGFAKEITDSLVALKLALSISVLILLLPIYLATWSFNDIQLVKIFQSVGRKPAVLVAYERALMDELWIIPDTLEGANIALNKFLTISTSLPNTQGIEHFFWPQKPKKPVTRAALDSGRLSSVAELPGTDSNDLIRRASPSDRNWGHCANPKPYARPARRTTINLAMLDLKLHPELSEPSNAIVTQYDSPVEDMGKYIKFGEPGDYGDPVPDLDPLGAPQQTNSEADKVYNEFWSTWINLDGVP